MKIFKYLNFALAAPLFFLLAGCGGGGSSSGGGTDVQGLEIAEQMALVDANSDSNANLSHALIKWAVPTGGEYITDPTDIYVYDESMQGLDLVNEILCSFEQTKYADMVNQGAYIAMNDKTLCSRNDDRSQDSSNQSSSDSQEFERWVVQVTRDSDTSDEIVEAWIPGGDGQDPFDTIRAKVTITEAKSTTYPFGLFSMDIAGYTDGVATPTMTGNLSSISNADGNAEFEFFIDAGAGMQERTHAILSPDGTSGQAYAYRMLSFSNMDINANEGPPEDVEETVQVAFDENHYLTDFGSSTKCLDRNDFNENVWKYNLYNSDGTRKTFLNGSFGIKVPGASEGHNYGMAGYHGIWLPPEITVTNGLAVTRVDDDAAYTVFMGNGRLIRNTKAGLTLADFVGDDFQMWDQDSGTQYIVSWNGTTLLKTGEQTCGQNGCVITDIAPVAVTLTPNQWINIWKQGLGNLTVPIPESGTISNTTEVVFTTQEYVKPDDAVFASGDLTLYCYDQCVRGGLTQGELNSGDIFFDPRFDPNAEPYIYTINGEDYTLMDPNGDPVIIDDSIDMTQASNYSWGVHSNAMSTVIPDNPWEIWSQTTTYAWETGNNSWNRYSTLLDSNGAAASFDAPLSCAYTDDTYGKFYLEYSGPGQLQGIPFNKIENDESGWEHWVAAFVIPDGSEVTCNGTAYYTKAMSVEQTMQDVDVSNCASLTTGTVAAPTNVYTPNGLGAEPTASNVAVIGGVLQ